MDPVTLATLIVFSLILVIGLLIFAWGFLAVHGPLIAVCWSAGMVLYIGCACLWSWLEDELAAREQAEERRRAADPDRYPTWEQD